MTFQCLDNLGQVSLMDAAPIIVTLLDEALALAQPFAEQAL